MKKNCLFAIFAVFMAMLSFAQAPNRCSYVVPRQADNWLFYFNAGIKFEDAGITNNNLPAGNNNLAAGVGVATLSDSSGNLLLYSTGLKIFNNQHQIINDANLKGDNSSSQAALIIQNPGIPQMLYVFTTGRIDLANGLNYSRVDMTARAGNGAVMEADKPLLSSAIPMVCGVKHSNGIDYWVMTHKSNNNEFYAYKVDASGVNTSPVVSSVGDAISSDKNNFEWLGTMKFSPKGDKVALASFGKDFIQVFSFDNSTGKVSNPSTITPTVPTNAHGPFWIEFSPDGNLLYATVVERQTLNGKQNALWQFDLLNGAAATQLNIAPNDADDVVSLQLGRDGKIYVMRQNESVLGVIANPNREGSACNYDQAYFGLNGAKGFTGLPNFVSSFVDIPPIDYDTKCDGDQTLFTLLNTSNIDNVDWNFGDTASTDNTATALNPTHVFSGPGNYTVTWTEHFAGNSWTDSLKVLINPLPVQSFAAVYPNDTAYIVDGSSIALYGNENMYSYYWQDGSTNIGYLATQPGTYTVLVEDWNCCQSMDTLYVLGLNIKMPTAFSPDNNGLNDVFRVLSSQGEGISPVDEGSMRDFSFAVFDKWGQMLWETNNIHEGWDGKIGSAPAPTGLYNWHMKFNVPGNIMNNGMINLHGSVMLFR